MATGPHKGWGGPRPNSGRPRKHPAELASVSSRFLRAAKKRAEKEGKALCDVLLDMIYSKKETTKDRIAATKLYLDVIVPKKTESSETSKNQKDKPIKLPEMKPDPAKVIQMKGIQ